ncbi:MAG: hypothetical protein V7K72_00395 [Nostoc sp.]
MDLILSSFLNQIILPNTNGIIADFYIEIETTFSQTVNTLYLFQNGTRNFSQQATKWKGWGGTISGDINNNDTVWNLEYTFKTRVLFNREQSLSRIVVLSPPPLGIDAIPDIAISFMDKATYDALNPVTLVQNRAIFPEIFRETNVYNYYLICDDDDFITPPPPTKHKPKDCECMCNDSLVKLLLQRIGNLPASVPDNFASKTPHQITLNSLAEMLIWQAQQMDALAGQYPIPLTIKGDPTDSNSKDQHLELPNQAETLAEILGLLVTTKRDTHATLIGIIKVLAESGMIKSLATQTYDVTHANAEFLGYKLEQVKRTIPSTFTPNGKNLAETFKQTNIDITSYENKDSTDLQDDLKKLLQMAARWNAQNWRTIGANAAVSLAQNFMGNVDTVTNTHEAIKQEIFADFLKEVEQGFTHAEGVTDASDPWGNPIDEAPTVRQIGITAESAAEAQQQVATQNALTGRSDSVTKDVAVQTAITKIANTLKAL